MKNTSLQRHQTFNSSSRLYKTRRIFTIKISSTSNLLISTVITNLNSKITSSHPSNRCSSLIINPPSTSNTNHCTSSHTHSKTTIWIIQDNPYKSIKSSKCEPVWILKSSLRTLTWMVISLANTHLKYHKILKFHTSTMTMWLRPKSQCFQIKTQRLNYWTFKHRRHQCRKTMSSHRCILTTQSCWRRKEMEQLNCWSLSLRSKGQISNVNGQPTSKRPSAN